MAVNHTGSFLLQEILNKILFTSKSFSAFQTTDLYYALSLLSQTLRKTRFSDLSEYSAGRKLTSPESRSGPFFFALDYDLVVPTAVFSENGKATSTF